MDAFLLARRAMFRTGVSLPKTAPAAGEMPAPDPVLMRFATLGGAVVTVTRENGQSSPYLACCHGCDWTTRDVGPSSSRDNANRHAGECRSMPKPTA
jgi:hypothetical protein